MNYIFKLTLFLIIFIIIASIPQIVNAETITYTISDGTLVFDTSSGKITRFTGNSTNVEIPSTINGFTVNIIGERAFSSCNNITSIIIPSSVTSIGLEAFLGCSSLSNVEMSTGILSIGIDAFRGCTTLSSITLPNSLTVISSGAFKECNSLSSIAIPSKVNVIGYTAFASCMSLTDITVDLNNTCYASEDGVLFNKTKSSLVQCPSGKIGTYSIPESVNSISVGAFTDCSKLTDVIIPNTITIINKLTFSGCSGLTSITIPFGVTSISDNAFQGCRKIISVNIPNTVVNIKANAFNDCRSLVNIIIPDNVTSIGDFAFGGCLSLTDITIPKSVTVIGSNTFYSCSNLSNINVDPDNESFTSLDGVLFNKSKSQLIRFPDRKTGTYMIPYGVTSISQSAFSDCRRLTSISIPSSITNIGNSIFNACSSLSTAYFYGNAPVMGSNVFYTGNNFTVYYLEASSGFTNPWFGYPTMIFTPTTSATPTLTPSPTPTTEPTTISNQVDSNSEANGTLAFSSATFYGYESKSTSVTILRTNGYSGEVSVKWSITGGSASFETDFTGEKEGIITFAEYERSKSINFSIIQDNDIENEETIQLSLSDAKDASFGIQTTTSITITDYIEVTKKTKDTVKSLTAINRSIDLRPGTSIHGILLATLSNGVSFNVSPDDSITWKSTNTKIATVTDGIIKAIGFGKTTVYAKYGGKTATFKVNTALKSLSAVDSTYNILTTSSILKMGLEDTEKIVINAKNADDIELDVSTDATWKSSNTKVATVEDGVITLGNTPGKSYITATYGGKLAKFKIDTSITSFTSSQSDIKIEIGTSIDITTTATYADETSSDVTSNTIWKSSNTKCVTIDDGKITGYAVGTTNITAKYKDKKTMITVEVK